MTPGPQPRPAATPVQAGDSGRYVQGHIIGSGGAGAVYTAWDQHLRRHVAIKRLPGSSPPANSLDHEFLREVHHLATLSHPNILSLHDLAQDQRGLFMVTEIVPGKNLRQTVEREPLSAEQCVRLAHQCLCALASIHQRNLIHNDIKPENIIVWQDGAGQWQIKLLDFGCARPKGELPRDAEGHVLGSIFYVCPETVRGDQTVVQSDLYSLGLVLHFALTGDEPFSGETPLEIARARLDRVPESVAHRRHDLSADFVSWLGGLVRIRPEERPASAVQALNSLEKTVVHASRLHRLWA